MAAFTAWLGLSGASIGGVPSEPVGGGYFRVNATGDLTGSAFTIPALTFGPALTRWGTLAGIAPEEHPELWAFVQKVAAVPAVARVIERERLQLNMGHTAA